MRAFAFLRDEGPDLATNRGRLLLGNFGLDDLTKTSGKVDLAGGDVSTVATVVEPVTEVHDDEERNGDVVGNEVRNRPVTVEEDRPSAEEHHDESGANGPPTAEGLEPCLVRQNIARHTLNLHGLVESEVHDTNAEPGNHTGDRVMLAK